MGKAKKTTKPKKAGTAKKTSTTKGTSIAKGTSTAKKKSTAKRSTGAAAAVERRGSQDRRKPSDRRKKGQPVAVERRKMERRVKVNRRRQIDPTTCERDYTPDEIEFMSALDDYKRVSGRMFPTCSEVLEVIKNLGYQKAETAGQPNLGLASSLSASPRSQSTAV